MAGISSDDLRHQAQEALYTAVGLGVLGVQHLQVQRRELNKALSGLCDRAARRRTSDADRTPPQTGS